jgi:arylsulfatase A-like enzyme
MPTLCEAAGIPAPEKQVGLSLLPVAVNSEQLDREFIAMEANNNKAQMIRSKQFKYAVFDNGDEYLFDMNNDPGETVNLALDEDYSEQLNHHRTLFKDWIARLDVDPRVPKENRWDLD